MDYEAIATALTADLMDADTGLIAALPVVAGVFALFLGIKLIPKLVKRFAK
jgi:hypothetical protein